MYRLVWVQGYYFSVVLFVGFEGVLLFLGQMLFIPAFAFHDFLKKQTLAQVYFNVHLTIAANTFSRAVFYIVCMRVFYSFDFIVLLIFPSFHCDFVQWKREVEVP